MEKIQLLKLKQLKEAEQAIEFGLKRLPDQFNLLIFAPKSIDTFIIQVICTEN